MAQGPHLCSDSRTRAALRPTRSSAGSHHRGQACPVLQLHQDDQEGRGQLGHCPSEPPPASLSINNGKKTCPVASLPGRLETHKPEHPALEQLVGQYPPRKSSGSQGRADGDTVPPCSGKQHTEPSTPAQKRGELGPRSPWSTSGQWHRRGTSCLAFKIVFCNEKVGT